MYTTTGTPESEMEVDFTTDTPRKKTPTVAPSSGTQLPESSNCLACSEDGRYLSLGHSQGLSVWCASSLICVAELLQERLEITYIQMARMAETTYLLATVDDMGVARVFAYHNKGIYLLRVMNIMGNINKRSICLTFEVSEGGDYGAASMSCSGALWLEVYQFPSEAWLKELEKASQKQNADLSGKVDVKWSPVAVVNKIKPFIIPAGKGMGDPFDFRQMTDFLTNCLVLDAHTSSHEQEQKTFNTGKAKEIYENPRHCTHHFLLPCAQFPDDGKTKSKTGLPVAVCVWWRGSRNLTQYLLQKVPNINPAVEAVPDLLWPNAKEILCSSVSRCTRYIALGLDDGLVCVWDRQSVSPLSVVLVSATDSPFFRIQFVDYWSVSADHSQTFTTVKIQLLVLCKSGEIHTVSTGQGIQSCTEQLTERPKHSRHIPSVTASVPFLQNMLLVVQRNGKMFLQDTIQKNLVCFLVPPTTHLIASPCSPVYAWNTKEHTLFIKGDEDPSCSASSEGESQSQLFIFRFGECDITKQYVVSLPDSELQRETLGSGTLEEACDLYLRQRALSADERNKALKQAWKQLEETGVTLQQRHCRDAAS